MLCSADRECMTAAAPYTVCHDDTFYKISKYYNITLDDLMEANPNANPDHIKVGDTLCIPLSLQNIQCASGSETYTVLENDSIYKLSQKFNISMNILLKANPRINPDALLPGQIICIPKPWNEYINNEYKISFLYPTRWAKINTLHYEGVDGFFHISTMNSGKSLEEICYTEAHHKLKPYGSRPEIILTTAAGLNAGLVLPSADQPMEMKKQGAIILQYNDELEVNNQKYNHLLIRVDKDHISDIKNSLFMID